MVGVSAVRVFAAEQFSITTGLTYGETYAIVGGLSLEDEDAGGEQ